MKPWYNPYMLAALEQSKLALTFNEVPIGAIITYNKEIIAASHNLVINNNDPTAHAEINVIRQATKLLKTSRLESCDLYTTLEPCPMCAQAISFARISKLYFGAYDIKAGGVISGAKIFQQKSCFHKPDIYGGIMEEECSLGLKDFFKDKR